MSAAPGFDTAGLRRAVLDAWSASVARFREDANAEEELVLGAYRDRLIPELAQNAADAAARAGVPGRVRFEVRNGVLTVANTGAPLDANGVQALSTLRASAKRDGGSVGRFGVGFAATLTVSDAPELHSRSGAVRWSAAATREAVAEISALAEETDRRGGAVPVLRLPFDVPARVPDGWDTVVVLPLRNAAAVEVVAAGLRGVDAALLLALPGLASVEIETDDGARLVRADRDGDWVEVTDGTERTRWRVLHRAGQIDPTLLADRPVEERVRGRWSLTWAVPIRDGAPGALPASTPAMLHAPTPTDDPLEFPALLLGSFPLDSARRRVAPGALTDFLAGESADAYSDLLRQLAEDMPVLALVPGPLGVGEFDAALRRAVLERLGETPFLPAAAGGGRLTPREAVLIRAADAALIELLAEVLPGLVAAEVTGAAPFRLGARVVSVAEVVDDLVGLDRDPAWWARLYAALAGQDLESLRGLPVPLADGRLVRDPRDLWLPGPVPVELLRTLDLRAVHPDAVHPLLDRLGARSATPAALLVGSTLALKVAGLCDDEDDEPDAVAEALLSIVAADPPTEPLTWTVEDLPLRAEDGELEAAGDLLLPNSPLRTVFDADEFAVVSPDLVERFGTDALRAVGVIDSFPVVRDSDVAVDPDTVDHDLDGEDDWLESLAEALPEEARSAPEYVSEFLALRHLDLVRADAWPAALRLLATPPVRAAVLEPARVVCGDGRVMDVPSYTAWWLRTRPILDGHRPMDLRLPDGDPRLAGLWEDAPDGLDPEFARALGMRGDLAEVLADPDGAADLLERLGDPDRVVSAAALTALYAALVEVDPDLVPEQDRLRVPDGTGTRVVSAEDVVVVDDPDLLPVVTGHVLPAAGADAARLAEVLDVPLASRTHAATVRSVGVEVTVPEVARRVLAGVPTSYVEHQHLLVAGPGGDVEVEWRWVDGTLHVATGEGLGFGLAWACGAWSRRWLICAVLAEPERVEDLLIADTFG